MSAHPPRTGQQPSRNPAAGLGAALVLVLLAGCAPSPDPAPARLRYDGVYAGGDYPYGCVREGEFLNFYPELWDLIRFYPDGTVIEEEAGMFLTPRNSQKYLTRENKGSSHRGTYSVDGDRISFVTTVPKRIGGQTLATDRIRSSGRIEADRLILRRRHPDSDSEHWWTRVFGKSEEFRFCPF